MARHKAPILAALVAVAGCTPVEMRGASAPHAERVCADGPVQRYVGRGGEAGAIEGIRRASGARTVRVLRPGEMATMDFRPDRVTVTVDAHRVIARIACG